MSFFFMHYPLLMKDRAVESWAFPMSLEVQDIMISKVVTGRVSISVKEAVDIMNEHGIGCLVVVEKEIPVGIVTERDLLKRVLAEFKDPRKINVQEIMSKPLIVGKPDMLIEEVIKLMIDKKIKKLPIVENGKLLGLVTLTDIVSFQPQLIRVVKQLTHPHEWEKVEEK
jgi:CBS domain-containing protein